LQPLVLRVWRSLGTADRCAAAQATVKFKKALLLDSRKHDALWCLGNAYTSQARHRPHVPPAPGYPLCTGAGLWVGRLESLTLARPPPQGFLTTDTMRAHEFFDLANDCFKKAIAEVRGSPCPSACTLLRAERCSSGRYHDLRQAERPCLCTHYLKNHRSAAGKCCQETPCAACSAVVRFRSGQTQQLVPKVAILHLLSLMLEVGVEGR